MLTKTAGEIYDAIRQASDLISQRQTADPPPSADEMHYLRDAYNDLELASESVLRNDYGTAANYVHEASVELQTYLATHAVDFDPDLAFSGIFDSLRMLSDSLRNAQAPSGNS